jgi:adhesin/invasin
VRTSLVGAVLGTLVLAACGETSVNTPLPAARMEAVGGQPQGVAGAPLPVEIQVFSADDQPLPGAALTFAASNGGTVSPASATSDGDGIARTTWTLGQTAGQQTLTVTSGSVSNPITATVSAGAPASVALVAGDNQTAPAGSAVGTAPSVRVSDAFGNLVAQAPVSFSVLSGGGQVTGGIRLTNAQGVATVGSWVLGPSAGTQTLTGRVETGGVANNPIIFTATATPPAGAQMVIVSGNNQTAPVGRLVPVAPTVQVRNAGGTPVPGVSVTFTVASGGGAVVGSRQITDASGTATVGGWFLGSTPGANTLTASAQGTTPVTFTATAQAGQAVSMVAVSTTSQTAPAGANVVNPPSVAVRDAAGIPVAGVQVTFTVTLGGGSVTGSPATTNASGIATLTSWKLGNVAGANTVTATATGLPSVIFNATGGAGNAANVVIHDPNNTNNQVAVQGTAVPVQPAVKVTDSNGNPVVGAIVTFAVTGGGGAATGLNQATDLLGLASVGTWTLGNQAPNTLRATVTGNNITGNPVTFTAQSATNIGVTAIPPSPAPINTAFTISVRLRNTANAPVSLAGVSLTIGVTGGGALGGTLTRSTDASGTVNFTGLTVSSAGARTFTITGTGLTSAVTASITFN